MKQDNAYLFDILDSAKIALEYVAKKSFDDFCKNLECQDAVIRRLEIIGEAARHVSAGTKKKLDKVSWHAMMGMRNFVIHEYEDIDLKIVWATLQNDLPKLVSVLQSVVPPESKTQI